MSARVQSWVLQPTAGAMPREAAVFAREMNAVPGHLVWLARRKRDSAQPPGVCS